MSYNLRALVLALTVLNLLLILIYQIYLEWPEKNQQRVQLYSNNTLSPKDVTDVVVLWWTPFTGDLGSFLDCGNVRCFFTQDRQFRYHPKAQMYLFYGSNIEPWDLPLPKADNDYWALLHEESPKNVPLLSHNDALGLFNHGATFSRHSDVSLTLQYLSSLEDLTGGQYVIPVSEKNKLLKNVAPVLYVQSDCDTPLDRDRYVKELMKYIPVDSYGACLSNSKLPDSLTNPTESMESEEFLRFIARYKFILSLENAVCDDYITEKLWRTLIVGSVPIYLGSPSVQDWLPNNNSAILISKFKTPENLSQYILQLNYNDEEYTGLLLHKKGIISNQRLIDVMTARPWGLPNKPNFHFINQFECVMCEKAHEYAAGKTIHRKLTEKDYFCPKPLSSLTGKEDPTNPWLYHWALGRCEASVLREEVEAGQSLINREKFNAEVKRRYTHSLC